MSYDLVLRRQSPRNYSRDSGPSSAREPPRTSAERSLLVPAATGLATAAVAALLLGRARGVGKKVERTYYRATRRVPRPTLKTPAVTMHDLVYDPERDS